MIDLHCHSTFSDGALTPEELIQKAELSGMRCISLTDHDTVMGYETLLQAAKNTSIKIINGIELSTQWKKHDIHILGYNIQFTDAFYELIQLQNQRRMERAQLIGSLLENIGIENAFDKACALASHGSVGRPHFARLLVNERKAKDMQSAFKQFLGRGKCAYVSSSWLPLEDIIKGIHDAQGVAVIAHPLKYGLTRTKLHELINDFKGFGGTGMEVVSGTMTMMEVLEMAAACTRFELLASSGSDFHSSSFSRTDLGKQRQLPVNCKPVWHDWNI